MEGGENMAKPDLEQSLGQEQQPQRTRRIPLRGIGFDMEGVVKFAGEIGGPPNSIELSGEALQRFEEREAKLRKELVDLFVKQGETLEEARKLAGLD